MCLFQFQALFPHDLSFYCEHLSIDKKFQALKTTKLATVFKTEGEITEKVRGKHIKSNILVALQTNMGDNSISPVDYWFHCYFIFVTMVKKYGVLPDYLGQK